MQVYTPAIYVYVPFYHPLPGTGCVIINILAHCCIHLRIFDYYKVEYFAICC